MSVVQENDIAETIIRKKVDTVSKVELSRFKEQELQIEENGWEFFCFN